MRIYTIIIIGTSIVCAMPSAACNFTDAVLLRLYCINRVRPAIKIIKQLTPEQLSWADKPMLVLTGQYQDKSVLQLWDDLKSYKYMQDVTFCPYLLCRVLLVLLQSKKVSTSHLQKDFDGINVEEFLSAIDVVVSHVHHINQHYHDTGLSFDAWLKEYWWIPSLFASSIFIKILKYYYLDSRDDFSWTIRSSSKLIGF